MKIEQTKHKWVCSKCGREIIEKPYKNQICNNDNCKGRFKRYTKCICGKWFENSKDEKKYCSDKCSGRKEYEKRTGKIKIKCFYCGKEFERYNSNVKCKKPFCSIDCMRNYEKTLKAKRKCMECGKVFYVYKSAITKTNASGNFCSRKCYDAYLGHQEHGKYYRADFEQVKKKYFSGVQFCAICGTTKNIHIHHIIPYRFTQDNGVDNLIPLCRKHHKMIECLWLPFISMMDDKELAKKYANISLRNRQYEVAYQLWKTRNLK